MQLSEISKILETDDNEASRILEGLISDYREGNGALEIVREGMKYQMRVKNLFADKVSHLAVSAELTKAVLRTLGLIATREPIMQSDVVRIIGNKAYDYVKELRENGFITAKKQGTTRLLSTTSKFEAYFGKKSSILKEAVTGVSVAE